MNKDIELHRGVTEFHRGSFSSSNKLESTNLTHYQKNNNHYGWYEVIVDQKENNFLYTLMTPKKQKMLYRQ